MFRCGSGGSFARFGWLAGGLDLYGAEGVGTDVNHELSVGGLGDVETIELSYGSGRFAPGDVRLAILVLHDSGNKVEHVAVVVGAGVDDVDDVESGDRFLRGDCAGSMARGDSCTSTVSWTSCWC